MAIDPRVRNNQAIGPRLLYHIYTTHCCARRLAPLYQIVCEYCAMPSGYLSHGYFD